MKFFKRILKYFVYIFIASWMFVLGIMVGRGTSPVKFDTQKFQKRLETIAKDFGSQKKIPDKIDLKFYEILDRPDFEDMVVPNKKIARKNKRVKISKKKISPEKEITKGPIPLKTSIKRRTFNKNNVKIISEYKTGNIPELKQNSSKKRKSKVIQGKYAVQIAAYKDFKDAVSQIAVLQKKGFSSYQIKRYTDGIVWYKVRSGNFISFDEAEKLKKKLKKVRINSLIIKLD